MTVAAAAVAALTGAQPPPPAAKADDTTGATDATGTTGTTTAQPGEFTATGGTAFHTRQAPPVDAGSPAPKVNVAPKGFGIADIPAGVFAAYRRATDRVAETDPTCHLPWQLLAAIGKVESSHARGGRLDSHGNARPTILGPQLNGNGFAVIRDTDNGAYDGDIFYDRAVGPMQFIPSTWSRWRTDGNSDGTAHPNNVYDSTLGAGHYLCAGGRDLANPWAMDQAILSYNYSAQYLATVTSWFMYYKHGYRVVPDGSGPLPPPPDSGGSPPAPAGPLPPTSAASGPGGATRPRPGVPATTPTTTAPPSTAPGTSSPPVTSEPPPASDPPASDPPVSDPPASDPPASDPPASDPPASDPPASDPPPSPDPPPSDTPSPTPSPSETPSTTPSPSPATSDSESTTSATPSAS